jgi:hypothetical protein
MTRILRTVTQISWVRDCKVIIIISMYKQHFVTPSLSIKILSLIIRDTPSKDGDLGSHLMSDA